MAESLKIAKTSDIERSRFLGRTYGWMALALIFSGIISLFTVTHIFDCTLAEIIDESISTSLLFEKITPAGILLFGGNMIGFWVIAIAEIITVLVLSARIRKMSVAGAAFGLILYSVLNGITLSSIFVIYKFASIVCCFFGCAAMFLVMCLWGLTTKKNLASFGRYMVMGLIGIVVTSFLGWLLQKFTGANLKMLDWVLLIASVIVFTGLAAYDSWKVARTADHARDTNDYKKVAIFAALELYLDFINLFLTILRIFGKRR